MAEVILQAVSVGPLAAARLARGGEGRVIAVFRSTVWLETEGGAFCVTDAGVEPGPLNLVTKAPAGGDWAAMGVALGQGVSLPLGWDLLETSPTYGSGDETFAEACRGDARPREGSVMPGGPVVLKSIDEPSASGRTTNALSGGRVRTRTAPAAKGPGDLSGFERAEPRTGMAHARRLRGTVGVSRRSTTIRIGEACLVGVNARTRRWKPAASDRRSLIAGMRGLEKYAVSRKTLPGFGAALVGDALLYRKAASLIARARDWCRGGTDLSWARSLIGLGPGLTPSGDDFLGGLMIGLLAVGRVEAAARLWAEIEAPARRETNVISFALLEAAAGGMGSAALHRALACIGRGEGPEAYAAGIDRLGHSSGWDAMAGIHVALAAECAAQAA